MKSPKSLLLGGVALLTATVVVAQLTPEQREAAEKALRQKIADMEAPKKSATAPKSQVVVKDSKKDGEAAKGMTPEQEARAREALAQSRAGGGLSPEQEAKARAALNQAYAAGSLAPDKEAMARAALNEAYAKADKSLSPEQEAKARAALGEAYAKLDKSLSPEQEAMARESLTAQYAALDKQEQERMAAAKANEPKPAEKKYGTAAKSSASKSSANGGKYEKPDDIALSQEQWNQLVDLTEDYKSDKVSASEYHAKRAGIVSGGGAQ
jgi:hypothetical protein